MYAVTLTDSNRGRRRGSQYPKDHRLSSRSRADPGAQGSHSSDPAYRVVRKRVSMVRKAANSSDDRPTRTTY
jgi:hypothetical protein